MRFSCPLPLLAIFCQMFLSAHAGGAAALFQSPLGSNPATGCSLHIHVDGLRNSVGVVGAAIFQSADGWPEDAAKALHIWPTAIPSGAKEATAAWDHLPPGNYGVVVIHDENENRKLDRNFVGIPKEGFGFANNPHIKLSAPPFQAAVVHVSCPVTDTTIHLVYK